MEIKEILSLKELGNNTKALLFITFIFFVSCKEKKIVILNIKNGSDTQKEIKWRVKLNGEYIYNGILTYTGISDEYTEVITKTNSASNILNIEEGLTGIILKQDTILAKRDTTVIYITYLYHKPTIEEINQIKYRLNLSGTNDFDTLNYFSSDKKIKITQQYW